MNAGWVPLWRDDVRLAGILKNHLAAALYVQLLVEATHEPRTVMFGEHAVQLEAGEVVTCRRQLAEDLGTTDRRIRTAITVLETVQLTTSRTTNGYTVFTLANYGVNGGGDQRGDQRSVTKATSGRPTGDQPSNYRRTEELKKEGRAPGRGDPDGPRPPREKTGAEADALQERRAREAARRGKGGLQLVGDGAPRIASGAARITELVGEGLSWPEAIEQEKQEREAATQ
ncbi:MAG: hypothetical protein JW819_09490 [Candidatus Krumholzibacteriota bacterium]|nr:hypothetical protein [Candidatus Krumholzibacteriota bacterium]